MAANTATRKAQKLQKTPQGGQDGQPLYPPGSPAEPPMRVAGGRTWPKADNVATLQTDKSTIPYPDVARWRSEFFACLICRSASSLRTESNTANAMQVGGVTVAVLRGRGPWIDGRSDLARYVGHHAPPAPKSLANWQTQFFSGHNSTCASGLRMKLSLPTVANSLANWQSQ
jgi:hypothetical protein